MKIKKENVSISLKYLPITKDQDINIQKMDDLKVAEYEIDEGEKDEDGLTEFNGYVIFKLNDKRYKVVFYMYEGDIALDTSESLSGDFTECEIDLIDEWFGDQFFANVVKGD